jgi:sugar phosphate isomerase/epimerase
VADVLAVAAGQVRHPVALFVLVESDDWLEHAGRIAWTVPRHHGPPQAVTTRRFGISTHLFHDERLTREHLERIARHGFDTVEVFATRSHVDYRDDAAVAALAAWLHETGLALHAVHAPVVEAVRQGQRVGPFSTAAGDEARRKAAVAEIGAALAIAARVPFTTLVVHLGVPTGDARADDNQPAAARRSVEEVAALADAAGVQVALEVIPNALSTPDALVRLIDDAEDLDVGVCLDFGHAHLLGEVGDAIEALSGHLATTHVHATRGRSDEHLPPFEGTIDWDAAIMGTQKIGYDGVLMFEAAGQGSPDDVLRRLAAARTRLESLFFDF